MRNFLTKACDKPFTSAPYMPWNQRADMTRALALLGSPSSWSRFIEKVKVPTLVRCTGFLRAAHCTSTPRSRTVSSKAGREGSGLARNASPIGGPPCH
eukprot:2939692-Amphidinium_carterae.1